MAGTSPHSSAFNWVPLEMVSPMHRGKAWSAVHVHGPVGGSLLSLQNSWTCGDPAMRPCLLAGELNLGIFIFKLQRFLPPVRTGGPCPRVADGEVEQGLTRGRTEARWTSGPRGEALLAEDAAGSQRGRSQVRGLRSSRCRWPLWCYKATAKCRCGSASRCISVGAKTGGKVVTLHTGGTWTHAASERTGPSTVSRTLTCIESVVMVACLQTQTPT